MSSFSDALFRWIAVALVATGAVVSIPAASAGRPWSFAVISDTQWTVPDDGQSPNSIPAGILKQIHQAFIAHGVRFVVDVGDCVDVSSTANLDARALYVQDLYNARIAYYPLRGNHEAADGNSGKEFARVFPQIGYNLDPDRGPVGPTQAAGRNNATPADILQKNPRLGIDSQIAPPARTEPNPFRVGGNFSYPVPVNDANGSVSYSFDYENARFVLLDQFDRTGNTHHSSVAQQQPWIAQRLKDPQRPQQAFVFSHKNLLGGAHKDNLFGGAVTGSDAGDGAAGTAAGMAKRQAEDAFIRSLAEGRVHYFITGHDHHHADSIIAGPLSGEFSVHQIISQSDSSKFYTPAPPFSANETPVSEELWTVGCYIYTVDGPRVTVDYYAVDITNRDGTNAAGWNADEHAISRTPSLTGNWKLRAVSGYSLNGREFQVRQGGSYAAVQDAVVQGSADGEEYLGTSAKILAGVNGSARTTHDGRPLTKAISTGWAPGNAELASDVLKLWGMQDLGADRTDDCVLSVSYDASRLPDDRAASGRYGLLSRDPSGRWVGATRLNAGGAGAFHLRAYDSTADRLGDWGINLTDHTAWAVINHAAGDFAVGGVGTAP
ncbi:MAG: metallophosphoesterase [Candidatus Brocadiia bacterium]|jgi:hypothetical protein